MSEIEGLDISDGKRHRFNTSFQAVQEERTNIYKGLGDIINNNVEATQKVSIIIDYLNSKHGMMGSERKKTINKVYKTLLDNFIPAYMKLIISESCRDDLTEQSDDLKRIMYGSKQMKNEMNTQHKVGFYEQAMAVMNTDKM